MVSAITAMDARAENRSFVFCISAILGGQMQILQERKSADALHL